MKTEKELKDRCTPDIIKKMVELAEGFEFDDKYDHVLLTNNDRASIDDMMDYTIMFSTLIHRAVEGWNKKCGFNNGVVLYPDHIELNIECGDKVFEFRYLNYQLENLTALECACLHCLLEIFEEKV